MNFIMFHLPQGQGERSTPLMYLYVLIWWLITLALVTLHHLCSHSFSLLISPHISCDLVFFHKHPSFSCALSFIGSVASSFIWERSAVNLGERRRERPEGPLWEPAWCKWHINTSVLSVCREEKKKSISCKTVIIASKTQGWELASTDNVSVHTLLTEIIYLHLRNQQQWQDKIVFSLPMIS